MFIVTIASMLDCMHKNILAKVFGDKKRTFLIKMPFLGQLLKSFFKEKNWRFDKK